jgi:hypothetical protein
MVAIFAHPDDRIARLTHANLCRQGVKVELLDSARLLGDTGLSWSVTPPGGFLDLGSRVVELGELHSILVRRNPVSLHTPRAAGDDAYGEFELLATMLGLLASHPGLVVNRPRFLDAVRPILSQPGVVVRCGLKLAPALVTSEPEAAAGFFADVCRGEAMVGSPTAPGALPIGQGATLAAVSGPRGGGEIDARVREAPMAIQARPAGIRLTVVVVGKRAIACARDAQGTWQLAELSAEVEDACVRLARSLQLGFAGVDLVLDGADATCLDVSGFPELSACSWDVENAVISALCRLLANGDRG